MNDTVPAEIDAIHGQHVFRKIVFNRFIHPEFPLARFFIGQHIGNLIIKNPVVFLRAKIDLPVFKRSDFYLIAPRRKFDKHDIFQRPLDILCVGKSLRLPEPVIGYVIFFVHFEDFFARHIIARNFFNDKSVFTIFQII